MQWKCCVDFHSVGSAIENKWFAQEMSDMLKKKKKKRSGRIKLYIYSLNDTHPSWLQLMIKNMWVGVAPHAVKLTIG